MPLDAPKRGGAHMAGEFGVNLAEDMDPDDLRRIAIDVLEGIEADLDSRQDWLDMAERAITLLSLEYKETGSELDKGTVSVVESTLILEMSIRFWALAEAEFLPADGPVKVKDDEPSPVPAGPDLSQVEAMGSGLAGPPPMPPPGRAPGGPIPVPGAQAPAPMPQMPMQQTAPAMMTGMMQPPQQQPSPPMGHNGPPEPLTRADLAEALEKDMNHFLTKVDRQYYPDFSRMLFSLGPKGTEFRKIYRCMKRKRPVSEWVRADNLIVSQEAAHLSTALRVTERLWRHTSEVRQLQDMGWWRECDLVKAREQPSNVDKTIAQVQGTDDAPKRQQDQRHEIYECYTDYDMPGYEHPEGRWLPYRITIDRHSRQILEIRRNWKESDEECMARVRYVMFGMVPGLKFYALGLVHMAANQQRALTAIERILIDSGMFASFPGFLKAKAAGRAGTTDLRVKPGTVKDIDLAGLQDIGKVIMPIPYKEPSAALMQIWQTLAEDTRRALGGLEQMVGEGRQDVPVGSMLAQIEQSTKVMAAVHKGLHQSRAQELELLHELFMEDPSALWKFAKAPRRKWEQVEELQDLELVPSSDPNVPSHLHRIMIAWASLQLASPPLGSPQLYNMKRLHEDARRILGLAVDEGVWAPPPAGPPPPDPKLQVAQIKAQSDAQEQQRKAAESAVQLQAKAEQTQLEAQNAQADRESKERVATLEAMTERERLQAQMAQHVNTTASELHQHHSGLAEDARQHTVDTLSELAQPPQQPPAGPAQGQP